MILVSRPRHRYYALKRQDERKFKHEEEKKQESDRKRREAAYRRLAGISERIVSHPPTGTNAAGETVRSLSEQEYNTIDSTIHKTSMFCPIRQSQHGTPSKS